MTLERACIECKQVPVKYYDIDIGRVCHDCFNSKSELVITKPTFTKKVCTTHKCSTYNSNQMAAHEMPWCNIVSVETIGIVKPKTQYDSSMGGLNGNIGRHYYKDWTEYCQQQDKLTHAQKNWIKFRNEHGRRKGRKPVAYY